MCKLCYFNSLRFLSAFSAWNDEGHTTVDCRKRGAPGKRTTIVSKHPYFWSSDEGHNPQWRELFIPCRCGSAGTTWGVRIQSYWPEDSCLPNTEKWLTKRKLKRMVSISYLIWKSDWARMESVRVPKTLIRPGWGIKCRQLNKPSQLYPNKWQYLFSKSTPFRETYTGEFNSPKLRRNVKLNLRMSLAPVQHAW